MKLHRGIGINDCNYQTSKYLKIGPNKWKMIWRCPYYARWDKLMERLGPFNKNKNYFDKYCCEEWKYFSSFKNWMEKQVWQNQELDKDILIKGNKIYSPETCAFVPPWINTLFMLNTYRKGSYPIGVTLSSKGQFRAQVSKIETKTNLHLGLFKTPQEAHKAWQVGKADQILKAAELYKTEESYREDIYFAILERREKLLEDNFKNIETFSL